MISIPDLASVPAGCRAVRQPRLGLDQRRHAARHRAQLRLHPVPSEWLACTDRVELPVSHPTFVCAVPNPTTRVSACSNGPTARWRSGGRWSWASPWCLSTVSVRSCLLVRPPHSFDGCLPLLLHAACCCLFFVPLHRKRRAPRRLRLLRRPCGRATRPPGAGEPVDTG